MNVFRRKKFLLKAGDHHILLGTKTCLMGILNVTPDSFSHDGLLKSPRNSLSHALRQATKFIAHGADILDIGGESSRPGAERIPACEEKSRVLPLITALAKSVKVPVSIDSYKPSVIKAALDAGATIVNNIKGTTSEPATLKMIGRYRAAIVIMHMQGHPRNMQKNICYGRIIQDITDELKRSIEKCLENGIESDRIVIDPGIGFGKTVEQNLQLINRCSQFSKLNKPILLGPSRKSFIGAILGNDVRKRLNGTLASVTTGILRGAHMIRGHDIKALKEAIAITDAIVNETV